MKFTLDTKTTAFLWQVTNFGIVGSSAFLVHFCLVYWLVGNHCLPPLTANIIGFFIAFIVSYFGHRYLTFKSHVQPLTSLWRLFLVGFINLLLNEIGYFIFLEIFNLQYLLALFINLSLLAILTFVVSKYWVFQHTNLEKPL